MKSRLGSPSIFPKRRHRHLQTGKIQKAAHFRILRALMRGHISLGSAATSHPPNERGDRKIT